METATLDDVRKVLKQRLEAGQTLKEMAEQANDQIDAETIRRFIKDPSRNPRRFTADQLEDLATQPFTTVARHTAPPRVSSSLSSKVDLLVKTRKRLLHYLASSRQPVAHFAQAAGVGPGPVHSLRHDGVPTYRNVKLIADHLDRIAAEAAIQARLAQVEQLQPGTNVEVIDGRAVLTGMPQVGVQPTKPLTATQIAGLEQTDPGYSGGQMPPDEEVGRGFRAAVDRLYRVADEQLPSALQSEEDPEITAIRKVLAALAGLDGPTQERVLKYVRDRLLTGSFNAAVRTATLS